MHIRHSVLYLLLFQIEISEAYIKVSVSYELIQL